MSNAEDLGHAEDLGLGHAHDRSLGHAHDRSLTSLDDRPGSAPIRSNFSGSEPSKNESKVDKEETKGGLFGSFFTSIFSRWTSKSNEETSNKNKIQNNIVNTDKETYHDASSTMQKPTGSIEPNPKMDPTTIIPETTDSIKVPTIPTVPQVPDVPEVPDAEAIKEPGRVKGPSGPEAKIKDAGPNFDFGFEESLSKSDESEESIRERPTFKLGSYIVWEDIIGTGSFSIVYKGYHAVTRQMVAVKSIIVRKKDLARIKFEISIMKDLNHPNIVKLYDVIHLVSQNKIYIIMEYCSGGTLDKYKDVLEPLTESQIHHYMIGLRNGLRYLREKNVFHRDLKPQNLLLTEDNILKISDFGLSTSLENDRLTSTICGSPIYMAPEVIGSNLYGVKADLWSVGIILYQLVYRKHPYVFTDVMQLIKEINTKKIKFPETDVSLRCIHLMTLLLQVQTEKRISWGEFFIHPWFDQSAFNKTPYYIVASNTPSLPIPGKQPSAAVAIPIPGIVQDGRKDPRKIDQGRSDGSEKSAATSGSSCTSTTLGAPDTTGTVTSTRSHNDTESSTRSDKTEKAENSNVSDEVDRPRLTLEDFICDNYENSTEICRSAPVKKTDFTDSIKKIRSKNYFGSSKSIGKITRRTSCIIQDPIPGGAPLNVRILPSKKT